MVILDQKASCATKIGIDMTEKRMPKITYQQRHVHCHIMDSASVTADILTSQSREKHRCNASHPGTKAPKYNIPIIPILNLPCVFHLL